MKPTITIHNTEPVASTNEHDWIGGRIPFLYWEDKNHIDVGTQGTHHGSIYRALGSNEWGEPHHGMAFVNQQAAENGHPSGRNMLWWSAEHPRFHQDIENVMRENFPQMNWDGGRSWSQFDDEFDWEDSEPSHTLGHTLGSVQVIDVPGKVPSMRHSDDMPYLYHVPSRKLYVGPRGAYHEDLDKAHPGVDAYWNWAEEGVNVDDYGRVIPDEHTYDWLRGRVDNPAHGNSHYDADAAYNPDAFKMLKPHWQAIDEAIGAPPQFIDYDWHTSAVEPGSDQVEYVPGKYHKGVLTANNTLHVWPLISDHMDAHPYHDEYSQGWNAYLQMKGADYEHQIDREDGYLGDTRFYIHPDPYAVNYADGENTNTYFVGHDNDTLQQRLNQHIPGIKVLDDHEFRQTDDGMNGWESSTHALPHALGAYGDDVDFDHNWETHKGILTHDDYLHIWPVGYDSYSEGYMPDEDGHPYHDEYAERRAIPQAKDKDTRFSIYTREGGAPQLITYRDRTAQPGFYDNHSTDTLLNRIGEHVPNIMAHHYTEPPVRDEEYSWNEDEFPSYLSSAHTLPSGEVHIALDVPERIRLQIARWVESLDLPTHALVDPLTYHITVAYAKEGVEYLRPSTVKNNFNMTGLKFDTHALSEFEGGALVLELENEYFTEWATKLVEYLEDQGIDCERYPGGPKPHITLAYDVEKPSHTLPPISFRCGPLSISTPRDASQVGLGPYTAAAPKIVEYPGEGSFAYNTGWMNERQPFIYDTNAHTIHVGPVGQHHGWIESQMGGSALEYARPNEKTHLYKGMMWHNPENIAEGLGINGGVSWWNEPPLARADAVAKAVRKAYPTSDWGELPVSDDWEEDWTSSVRTASAPATPPPWQPGSWGKGLFFDLPDGPQMSAWNTGTESLVRGAPHHNQVSEGIHGIPWGDMMDMMKAKQCYLLKVQPDGTAYECAMGHALPPSFDAIAQEHGLQRHPADNQEYAENDWS